MQNKKIKTYLDRLASSPKRPNSYLFAGPEEVGKFEAAIYFVARLAGKINDEEFLRRAKENIHPDVVVIEPEIVEDKKGRIREKEIIIDQVRKMQERLKFFPYELKQKFCLIKKAQKLNAEASNALLKILEEPTESTFFILLASDAESVLPTIASRCAVLRFVETKLPKWKEENRERLRKIFKEEIHEKFDYAGKISKDKNEMLAVLGDWEMIAAESLRKLARENQENLGHQPARNASRLRREAGGRNRGKIRRVVELIEKTRESINFLEHTNASARAVGESLMLDMSS